MPTMKESVAARVSEVTAAAYTIPTDAPEADGTLSWNETTLVVAQAHCGAVVGTGWTYGSTACAAVITGLLAGRVEGRNAFDIAGTFDAMVKALRNVGRHGVGGQALSAVDVALWDLKARLLQLPLHHLIGAVRDAVPVYGSGGFTCYDEQHLRDQLTGWTQELRIPRVKIKIGESWGARVDRDLARMRQARDTIGDTVELYVDANGAYGRKQAVRVMADAADLDVRWFEEPVSSDDLDGLRSVRDAVAPTWPPANTAMTCTTSAACAKRVRWTACRPTPPAAAASPNGCESRRSRPPTVWISRRTARRSCMPTWVRQPRTCATSNGSTITPASS